MKNLFSLSVKSAFFCCTLFFFTSCSKEEISEPRVESTLAENELSYSQYTSTNTGCSSSSIPIYPPTYSDFIDVGNGKQAKTLRTKVYNTDSFLFVEADYVATTNNENLPGKVTIDIGGTVFEFKDVNPGETVEAKLPIPTEWFSTYVDVNVKQMAFLEPAEVLVRFFIAEPCPVEIGAELMGGLVGYVLQPGDDGYVEGETHGLIISSDDIGEAGTMNWFDAMTAAESLELNGYNDWTLPTDDEAFDLIRSLPVELGYDPAFEYGYWTSVEVDENRALGATMRPDFSPSSPPTLETVEYDKDTQLQVRLVRRF